MEDPYITILICMAGSYMVGSLPFGFWIARMRGIDIREHGSGNIGATNIFRVLGAPTGIMVFLLDIMKGFTPVAIGKSIIEGKVIQPGLIEPAGNHQLISTACVLFALAAVIGHNYTFWLGFKGGKGIATSAGVMLAFIPWVFTGSLIIWVLVFSLSRYVALASMAAALAIPLQIFILAMIDGVPVSIPKLCFGIFAAIMAIWRHRSNIRRLMAGRELRFERKKTLKKNPEIMTTASVIGAGSWGTALATVLAQRGIEVKLWCRAPEQAAQMAASRENRRYLPGVTLGELITPTADLRATVQSGVILCVIPSAAMADLADSLAKAEVPQDSILVSCTKGLERGTGRRMTEILSAALPDNPIAVLSGPNHAEEVGRQLATAAVIGCNDQDIALRLQEIFTLPWFRTYTSEDVAGIELGGATKNVYAICAGISEGLGLGDNAKAALVTRGLAEMIRLGTNLGGAPETFQGLSGVGDLMVTCYSAHSRNNQVGKMLGEGKNIDAVLGSMTMVAEGVPNTLSFYEAARRAGINTPIIDQAYAVISGHKSPDIALNELLNRNPRPETDS